MLKLYLLDRFKEYYNNTQTTQLVTLFPYMNDMNKGKIYAAVLNFSFRDVGFSKKRVMPFFLAVELLTNQKCVATVSSKNVYVWTLRRGMLVGCKVTLRRHKLTEFLDTLLLALPRMEKVEPLDTGKLTTEFCVSVALNLTELVLFYPVEIGLGVSSEVRRIEINILFNTYTREEKYYLLVTNKIPIATKKTMIASKGELVPWVSADNHYIATVFYDQRKE